MQLLSSSGDIPFASKAGQAPIDFVEGDSVAAIVSSAGTEGQLAAGEDVRHRLGNLADLIVLPVTAHVESLVVDRVNICDEHAPYRASDVQRVHKGPPRRAVTGHCYSPSCPG